MPLAATLAPPALLRWTQALDRVLPPRQSAPPVDAAAQLAADARRWRFAAEGSVWRRTLVDVRHGVARTAGAVPLGPRLATHGQGVGGKLAATANLLAATLGCGARLTLALLASCAAAPAGPLLALGRALKLGRPPAAPPVLDWQLDDAHQRAAFAGRLCAALQLKVRAAGREGGLPFAQTQLGKDLARDAYLVSIRDEGEWVALGTPQEAAAGTRPSAPVAAHGASVSASAPETSATVASRLRALTEGDDAWHHQLAAVASQSLANGLLDALFDGVGWRRVGGEVLAPGEAPAAAGVAHFFQRRDAFRLELAGARPGPHADARPHVRLRATLTWSPEASAAAWQNVCLMDRTAPPRAQSFAPQGLQLQLSLHLLRPFAGAPDELRIDQVRLRVRAQAGSRDGR